MASVSFDILDIAVLAFLFCVGLIAWKLGCFCHRPTRLESQGCQTSWSELADLQWDLDLGMPGADSDVEDEEIFSVIQWQHGWLLSKHQYIEKWPHGLSAQDARQAWTSLPKRTIDGKRYAEIHDDEHSHESFHIKRRRMARHEDE